LYYDLKLKDLKQCKNCFEEIEIENNFCPKCGEKQENIKDEAKEVEIIDKLEDSKISEENQEEAEFVKENIEE
jgi:RNA polymerase subunit RPABC4/transcription elongation factor Spt4